MDVDYNIIIYYMCLVCHKVFKHGTFDADRVEESCPECGSLNYIKIQEIKKDE